jgi:hypothetical protein
MEMLSAVKLCLRVLSIDTPRSWMFGQYTLIKLPKQVISKVQGDYLNVYCNLSKTLNGPSKSFLLLSYLKEMLMEGSCSRNG